MKPDKVHWSFLNRSDLRQSNGFTFSQALFVASLIPQAEIDSWFIWHEGLAKWQPLRDCETLKAGSGAGITEPPIPPQEEGIQLRVEPIVDKRLSRRFLKEFKVEISSPRGAIHQTVTVNISATGMLIRDPVPESFGRNFPCRLSRADGSELNVFCAVVKSDEQNRARLRFLEVAQPRELNAWLIDSKVR